jgi:hypothetical protein
VRPLEPLVVPQLLFPRRLGPRDGPDLPIALHGIFHREPLWTEVTARDDAVIDFAVAHQNIVVAGSEFKIFASFRNDVLDAITNAQTVYIFDLTATDLQ